MSLVAALDTMAWIWAFKPPEHAKNNTERINCDRAARLFIWLEERKAQIIIPTVCVAELLTPLDEAEQHQMLALISRRLRPAVFDLPPSALAARLHRQAMEDRQKQKGDKPARHVLRADTLIVASARTAGATHFFTEDQDCRKIAERAGLKAMGLDDDPMMPLMEHRNT